MGGGNSANRIIKVTDYNGVFKNIYFIKSWLSP